jgi:biopolymer transport protein ExbB
MRYIITLFILTSFVFSSDSIEDILKNIQTSSNNWKSIDNQRIQTFLDETTKKEKLLKELKKQLKKEKQNTTKLQNNIASNEETITNLEEKLRIKTGNFGEIFGVVRQISNEFQSGIELSYTNTVLEKREPFLEKLSLSKELPQTHDLEKLWYLISQETIKNGLIETNTLEIITPSGTTTKQEVTNIGPFMALSQGELLKYNSDINKYQILNSDSSYINSYIKNFETQSGITNILIDPTKGALLELINEKPTLLERIEQGGVVGYVILSLGFIGVVLALIKLLLLQLESNKINKQLKSLDTINTNNALGRVLNNFKNFSIDFKSKDLTLFEAKLDEIVLKELYDLKKYENLIKLIATVAPLLGLLGTVTGMIETFNAITIFGTSDPKLMAGGISQALVTTVLGLSVAIPMLFLYTFISSKSNRLAGILDEQSAALIVKGSEK